MTRNEKFWQDIESSAQEIEARLNVEKDFILSLLSEDPWSFIIKTHALIEAAVSSTVVASIGKPDLEGWIASLPLNGKASKMSLLRKFAELESEDIQFVQSLSTLRNQLVHKIENVDFEYESYFNGLEPNKRDPLLKGLSYAFATEPGGSEVDTSPIYDNPQNTIWNGVRILLAFLNLHSKIVELDEVSIQQKLKIAELFSSR